ncbi:MULTISPECIES: 5-dehydro-2-deoxygluconokinase [unclassified Pseudovibrio]|uniref:bifunctional 5-dehydro-2-deoxygluconokinase/5-dehydro-2- deoxyphosphogluconate aldolase n=1 Tax=unclassified Pseudovibrio TaxID=2627060 RepID=UPI0007B1BD51|nr:MULTISPECIES: 5-dehydro-2-deoxygluconokinase [unclassified Pseudovibrio]KZL03563.1 5-dehydro-2-deoxygluconokinase [Pseudovibrio sp. W74]KZL10266.1 5-dehydro-2-deoxygluconokinase [Pseudovibrio sp. Ad14]
MLVPDWENPLKSLDVITIGRSSVDLYGTQVGSRLEDMSSFNKYVGGSPTNMSVGTARLGLKSALISRVGDEHMGRFIREQLVKEGVCVDGLVTDKDRLTALVILGIRDKEQFPLIFYRENCADMALCEDDIDPEFIAQSGCVTVTGTHLSHPRTEAAVLKALRLAKENGSRTALDIDYRPNLWGLAGHGDGEERFIASEKVTAELQKHLHLFDLIVGTEEEFHIAGGSTNTLEALNAVRKVSKAALVCKRGPMGAVVFEDTIGASLDDGKSGPGFPIEVFNVLGAGDGFMSGLLRGWLKDETWETTLTYANACGAFAVSRHGCAPAYPSWEELQWFLDNGSSEHALRKDRKLEQIHWSTNRKGEWSNMKVFAFDHRSQLEDMAAKVGASEDKIPEFKELCLKAAQQVRAGGDDYGILCDGRLGEEALFKATGSGLWIGRPVELPGSRPLELEIGPDLGSQLAEWPVEHVVKVLCFYHPDDSAEMKARQEETILRLAHACRENNLEFLLEVIPSKVGPVDDDTTATIIQRFYDLGVYPDWWKLEPLKTDAGWQKACDAIKSNDPWCRGIVVLGLDAPAEELAASFEVAGKYDLVKGFAVGRTIFAEAAEKWLGGNISDEEAIANMAAKFEGLGSVWEQARMDKKEVA